MVLFGGDVYDVSGDDSLSEEFKKYVRQQNLICEKSDPNVFVYYSYNYSISCQTGGHQYNNFHCTIKETLQRFRFGYHSGSLIQFWRAEEIIDDDTGKKQVLLTTRDLPFSVQGLYISNQNRICPYRMKMYDVIINGDGEGGVIGRVYQNKRMEFSQDVSFYSYTDYPHLDIARSCDIKLALFFPMIDSYGSVVGVVEIVSQYAQPDDIKCFLLLNCQWESLTHLDCCKVSGYKCVSEKELHSAASKIRKTMQLACNGGKNVVNTNDERGAPTTLMKKQNKKAQTSGDEQGKELPSGLIYEDLPQQPPVEVDIVRTEENVVGSSEECMMMNSSELTNKRGGIDISKKEVMDLCGLKREDAAKSLNVSVSTFKRVCRDYGISRWPP